MMREAFVFNHGVYAGRFIEQDDGGYAFIYDEAYQGSPISLTMPVIQKQFFFDAFPAFFDGVLPEGVMLEALLKSAKLDRSDYFGQLVQVGHDLVGSVTVESNK